MVSLHYTSFTSKKIVELICFTEERPRIQKNIFPLKQKEENLPPSEALASWLVRSTPEREVRVRALAGDIVLCSWARHFAPTVPLSTQVYKWVPANLMLGGNPAMDKHPIQGGVEILLVVSCYRNWDKLRPGGPHWPVCRLYLTYQGLSV